MALRTQPCAPEPNLLNVIMSANLISYNYGHVSFDRNTTQLSCCSQMTGSCGFSLIYSLTLITYSEASLFMSGCQNQILPFWLTFGVNFFTTLYTKNTIHLINQSFLPVEFLTILGGGETGRRLIAQIYLTKTTWYHLCQSGSLSQNSSQFLVFNSSSIVVATTIIWRLRLLILIDNNIPCVCWFI